ncbi:hypothetical protein [Paenibacillus eucommiae]|uniref:Uncharacterized protein n=1 Tax=Paenibacillus eucommiae TaxID=1355755 RepID=A0ABS4J7Q2_9BACL|nr:hypothetical protein [Paenibacillus eucommiae]MBP1995848.1 hypothetical protein [Paenibacillus eucommiae]
MRQVKKLVDGKLIILYDVFNKVNIYSLILVDRITGDCRSHFMQRAAGVLFLLLKSDLTYAKYKIYNL